MRNSYKSNQYDFTKENYIIDNKHLLKLPDFFHFLLHKGNITPGIGSMMAIYYIKGIKS